MIRAQRKNHFISWLLLAFLLPAGIISAWLLVPVPVRQHLLYPLPDGRLPVMDSTGVRFVRYDSVSARIPVTTTANHE